MKPLSMGMGGWVSENDRHGGGGRRGIPAGQLRDRGREGTASPGKFSG